jgi:large subunit ribosomal protein L6
MSRIGKKPIPVPAGVTITIDGSTVNVKGPRGAMSYTFRHGMTFNLENGILTVERPSDTKDDRALHGLTRAIINNMVLGTTQGFKRGLELVGVGYQAEKKGKAVVLNVGYSHIVSYPEPDGITITTPSPTVVLIEGNDKQKVGQVAAEIRAVRPPEPYKGKGIRYQGEQVRRKAGKTGAK